MQKGYTVLCNDLLSNVDSEHKDFRGALAACAHCSASTKIEVNVKGSPSGSSQDSSATKVLNLLDNHISSLEELKASYTKSFTVSIRGEIEAVWKKIFFGEEQKKSFELFCSEEFSKENLVLHEQELLRLKGIYSRNQALYKLVSKRERLWEEKVLFENPVDGSSRFENRGGTLIKELKRHQAVEKQLPVVEAEIKQKIRAWEKENAEKFLVQDQLYTKYIEDQKLEYKAEQEAKREAKRAERASKTEGVLTEMYQSPNPKAKPLLPSKSLTASSHKSIANQEKLKDLGRSSKSVLRRSVCKDTLTVPTTPKLLKRKSIFKVDTAKRKSIVKENISNRTTPKIGKRKSIVLSESAKRKMKRRSYK